MKTKALKSIAKKAGKIAVAGLQAKAAYGAAGKKNVDVKRIDRLKKSALKGALGEKNYKKMIQGTKDLIGEKNYRRLDRANEVALNVGDVGFQLSRGNFRGAKDSAAEAIDRGVGKKALRKAQHAGQDLIGKKNYNAIHHIGNRVLNTGLDTASVAAAIQRGNFKGAVDYGLNAVRTGAGAEAIHKVKRKIRDKIGQKNYDLLNNSYKAMRLGMDIGKTISQINEGYDAGKTQKMINKTYKLARQSEKAAKLIKHSHEQAGAHPNTGSIIAAPGPDPRPMVVTTSKVSDKAIIGGGGRKPM